MRDSEDQSFVGDLDSWTMLLDVLLLLFLPLSELIVHAIGRDDALDALFACLRVTNVQDCNPLVLLFLLRL